MSKKVACYNCRLMTICEVRTQVADAMHMAFRKQQLSAYDLPEVKMKAPSTRIFEVLAEGCLYFETFPKEESARLAAFQKIMSK